jgi:LmbE family N-acetylglucosaminyl deacetylase
MKRLAQKTMFGFSIFAITLLVILFCLANFYQTNYAYDLGQSYQYQLPYSKTVELKNQQCRLPKLAFPQKTAFLKITIQSSILSYIFQPYIEIVAHNGRQKQYFEHGAHGVRYLNVSDFVGPSAVKLTLLGHFIHLKDQRAGLITYDKIPLANANILIIAPHPDDAEIAAHGLYNQHKNAFVLTLTAGDGGKLLFQSFYNNDRLAYLNQGKLRTWNSITTPLAAGISSENVLNFGYLDGSLKAMYARRFVHRDPSNFNQADINVFRKQNISSYKNDLTAGADWSSLIANLKSVIRKYQPTVIVTPYPAIDIHPDHQFSSVAVFQALQELNYQQGSLFLYSNHYPLSDYYPYGEMNSSVTLPPAVDGTVYFNSVYVHSLLAPQQKDKFLALESMYALRSSTHEQNVANAFKTAFGIVKRKVLMQDLSYFRRAVRNHELFFVVPIKALSDSLVKKQLIGKH